MGTVGSNPTLSANCLGKPGLIASVSYLYTIMYAFYVPLELIPSWISVITLPSRQSILLCLAVPNLTVM